ncbi:cytosolic phospholipase A2 gamma-like [Sardina pilchardus]|uniref:cytosolic phospholipase A2 gamma-like n=1 Tax=Sardina pilchardus TaxID=27697 RepID=UPI002E13D6DA
MTTFGCMPSFNNVPHVALLGSGGGQRAHIGFLGVMRQLGREHLLDCMQYVAGVSGSTWCMSSLYQDPQWTQHAEEATNKALLSMSEGEGVTFHDGVQWMKQRYAEGDFSLTDLAQESRPLDQDGNGASLYPLYSAVEKHCFDKDQQKDMWFEFSPHEVGFLEPGAYVKTSLLKEDFEEGIMKPGHDVPEDMIQKEQMHLIDAGLYLNSPYPSALRAARDIDLIISFDFSDGDPFETLRVASDYADKNGHPFPKVDFTQLDPKRPKSYYVFEERGKPTVIHIPLFNMDNCKSK